MKNITKTIIFIILFFFFQENANSWTPYLNISNQQCLPTSYKTYSDVYLHQFEIHINRTPIIDPTLFKATVYFTQEGVTFSAGTYSINTDVANPQVIAMTINSLRPLCWNKDIIMKVHVYKNDNPSSSQDVYGYFRIYKESGGGTGNCTNDLKAVNDFDAISLHASDVQIQWSNQGCGFATGYTYCDRYKLSKTIYFQNDQVLNINASNSMGFSAIASGNNQQLWAGIESQNSTSATLVTFVYKLRDGTNRWHPCKPEEAAIAYTLTERPVIGALIQNPFPIQSYSSGTVKCNLFQGSDVRYIWTPINPSPYFSLATHGEYSNYATIYNNAPDNYDGPPFRVKCKAWNTLGYSESIITPTFGPIIAGGCPYILPYDSSFGFRNDNNILHRSEFDENYGKDIKDVYKLTYIPRAEDNILRLAIKETENDFNFFDKVKLYAIDHSPLNKVVVTESNDIAIYNIQTVVSPEEAYKNTSIITPLVQFDTVNIPEHRLITGDIDDSITADYSQERIQKVFNFSQSSNKGGLNDSLAIIAEIGSDQNDAPFPIIPIKRPAGVLTIESDSHNSIDKVFARRENISPIVIPFSNNSDAIESVSIKWLLDYSIKFLSIINISYDGFTKTEIPLIGAWHSTNGDILVNLQEVDSNYAELDSSAYLSLAFNDINPPIFGKTRDYIIEVNGRYLLGNYSNRNLNREFEETVESTQKIENAGLIGNYPNPFNPTTNINYIVSDFSKIRITIYDILGKEVFTLVNEFKTPGKYNVNFDAKNLASGVYYYKLQAGSFVQIKKMLLLK